MHRYNGTNTCSQQSCYSNALSASGCSPTDFNCQCSPGQGAAIALAHGPCFLAKCSFSDLSVFSSALTSACASATGVSTVGSKANAGAATTSAGATRSPTGQGLGPEETDGVPGGNIIADARKATVGLIIGIALGGTGAGVLGGILLYLFVVTQRRTQDEERQRWEEITREKVAAQASLGVMKESISRQGTGTGTGPGMGMGTYAGTYTGTGTLDTVGSLGGSQSAEGGFGSEKSVLVKQDGPVEMPVEMRQPAQVYFELPGSTSWRLSRV